MGSLGFWPLTVFLPISMHIAQHKIPRWSTQWILMHSLQVFCFFISVTAMIGSIVGVIEVRPGYGSPLSVCHQIAELQICQASMCGLLRPTLLLHGGFPAVSHSSAGACGLQDTRDYQLWHAAYSK